MSLAEIADGLRTRSKFDVPPDVLTTIEETIERYGLVKLVVHPDDPGLLRLEFASGYVAKLISQVEPLQEFLLEDGRRYWAIQPGHRGIFKQRALQEGWPIEDIAGFVPGAHLDIELREQMRGDYDALQSALAPFEAIGAAEYSYDDYCWAIASIWSRSMDLPIPAADGEGSAGAARARARPRRDVVRVPLPTSLSSGARRLESEIMVLQVVERDGAVGERAADAVDAAESAESDGSDVAPTASALRATREQAENDGDADNERTPEMELASNWNYQRVRLEEQFTRERRRRGR